MSAYKWILHCKTIKTGSIYHGFDTPTQPPGAASGGMDTPILRKNAFRPADRDERRENIFRGTTLIPGQAGHSLNAGNGALLRLRLLVFRSAPVLAGELRVMPLWTAHSRRPSSLKRGGWRYFPCSSQVLLFITALLKHIPLRNARGICAVLRKKQNMWKLLPGVIAACGGGCGGSGRASSPNK